jgi:NAD(P)-dependent dehydrogenase (short-subunit alcohol dehydrogenase family)
MTRALAFEWGKYNINVNVLAPTVTITDINRKYFTVEHRDELQKYIDQTPMGRIAEPDDYVGTAIFLASDASNFVTGQVVFVDGGHTL